GILARLDQPAARGFNVGLRLLQGRVVGQSQVPEDGEVDGSRGESGGSRGCTGDRVSGNGRRPGKIEGYIKLARLAAGRGQQSEAQPAHTLPHETEHPPSNLSTRKTLPREEILRTGW